MSARSFNSGSEFPFLGFFLNVVFFFFFFNFIDKEKSIIQKKVASRDHLPRKEKNTKVTHERVKGIHGEKWLILAQLHKLKREAPK